MRKYQKRMPPQRGVDRFYYPLKERPTDVASMNRRSFQPDAEALFESHTDPNGSYTGNPTDGGVPTQDADDL